MLNAFRLFFDIFRVRFMLTNPLSLFCSQLPKICLKEIASVIRYKRIKTGKTLYHKGQPTRLCYIVMNGSFSVYDHDGTTKKNQDEEIQNITTHTTTNAMHSSSREEINHTMFRSMNQQHHSETARERLTNLTRSSNLTQSLPLRTSSPSYGGSSKCVSRFTSPEKKMNTMNNRSMSPLLNGGKRKSINYSENKINNRSMSPSHGGKRTSMNHPNLNDRCSLMKYWTGK